MLLLLILFILFLLFVAGGVFISHWLFLLLVIIAVVALVRYL